VSGAVAQEQKKDKAGISSLIRDGKPDYGLQ
jgi:hypothetical protein